MGRKDGMIRKQIRECFILKPAYFPGGPIEDGFLLAQDKNGPDVPESGGRRLS